MKPKKAADACGLVAELPPEFLMVMVDLFNHVLFHDDVPVTWRKTFFQRLPEKHGVILTTVFRPIANIRLLYNTFAHLILHRIEACLDMEQPEKQNGFRATRRMEEHVFTTKLILDKKQKCQYGLLALICQKHLIGHIGRHHGEHFADKESHIIWFGFWKHFMQINGPSDGTIH